MLSFLVGQLSQENPGRGSCNNFLLRRVVRRLFNSKCFLEGFFEGKVFTPPPYSPALQLLPHTSLGRPLSEHAKRARELGEERKGREGKWLEGRIKNSSVRGPRAVGHSREISVHVVFSSLFDKSCCAKCFLPSAKLPKGT